MPGTDVLQDEELCTGLLTVLVQGSPVQDHSPKLESALHLECQKISGTTRRPCLAHDRHSCAAQSISLIFFIGMTRTVFEAGFALKTHGSLVKGLMPFFAFVAGLFFNFMLSIPASLNEPDFFTSDTATSINASTTAFASEVFSPAFSAAVVYAAVAVIPLPFIAFIAPM